MAKKIVTLYIGDTSLRLMVTHGKCIEEWAEVILEPELLQDTAGIKEAEVATKIKQLFKAQKVKAKKVMVGVSGLHCLTRPITFPRLPKEMLDEAVRREAARVLPVSLEQLYISWQTTPAPEGKTQVFLTAIPCKTADALLKALHQAGLEPSFMDIKPLLLARVVREATAVIVDVQTTEFDIVIMTDGVSQPIRTIPFASEALSSEEKLTIIKNELDRTITFYNSNNPENALASSVPIFVSGELADEPESCQTLSDQIGNTVLPLPSPLECPEGFSPSRYMANIGLALQELLSGKAAGPAVVNLNALPAAYQPKPISLTNVLGLPGGVVAIGLLVFLAMLVQGTSANMASISDQLNTTNQLLQQKLSQRQELTGQIAELENKITEVESASGNFTAALGSLETQSTGINRHLKITLESLPNTITLSSISYANNILTISGWAPSEREVSSYISNLGTGGRFGEITVANMSRIEGEGEGMDFTLLSSLQTEGDGTSSIEIALNNLPATISLTSVSSTDGTLTINGSSPDEDGILSYAQSLEASGEFSEITISRMTRIEDEGMDFSLVLKTGE
jgi:type IV pilus assembly protein PilM